MCNQAEKSSQSLADAEARDSAWKARFAQMSGGAFAVSASPAGTVAAAASQTSAPEKPPQRHAAP